MQWTVTSSQMVQAALHQYATVTNSELPSLCAELLFETEWLIFWMNLITHN